jgi:hypothetical protein
MATIAQTVKANIARKQQEHAENIAKKKKDAVDFFNGIIQHVATYQHIICESTVYTIDNIFDINFMQLTELTFAVNKVSDVCNNQDIIIFIANDNIVGNAFSAFLNWCHIQGLTLRFTRYMNDVGDKCLKLDVVLDE